MYANDVCKWWLTVRNNLFLWNVSLKLFLFGFFLQIQGAILVASLVQIVLGLSGLVGLVLKYIGPLAIAPTITLIGLSLFIEAGKKCGSHWGIAAL